jgi:hypothetical protein
MYQLRPHNPISLEEISILMYYCYCYYAGNSCGERLISNDAV